MKVDYSFGLWHSWLMKRLEETKEQIGEIMRCHGVVLGYVFGSYARSKMTPLSDVDVAVVFGEEVPDKEQFDQGIKIAGDVRRLLEIDRVDVINLNTAISPLLKHRAVIRGYRVLEFDQSTRIELEKSVLQEYEDTEYLREVQRRIMYNQIKKGTFGKPQISLFATKTS